MRLTGTPDLTYAAENAVKAVVNIEAIQEVEMRQRSYDPFLEFFGIPQERYYDGRPQIQERRAGGSGVIISEDGYIVTNNHVIDGASKLRVTLNDGSSYDAKVIGSDPTTDIALIKIDADKLPTRRSEVPTRCVGRMGTGHRLAVRPAFDNHGRYRKRQGPPSRRHTQ